MTIIPWKFANYGISLKVELVKSLFKEHEMFMQSLTESQDGVGRVLHRSVVEKKLLKFERFFNLEEIIIH